MRIASIDELETGSSAGRWSSPGGAVNDKTKKAIEPALVGRDIAVASDSKSELWRDLSLKRNMTCVDIARSPGSALRVFTSSERLAHHLKINEIGEVGKLVKKIEMAPPKIGKLMKRRAGWAIQKVEHWSS